MTPKKSRRQRLGERNDRIRATYKAEYLKGFRSEKIIGEMVDREHLDAASLENIIFRRGVYKDF